MKRPVPWRTALLRSSSLLVPLISFVAFLYYNLDLDVNSCLWWILVILFCVSITCNFLHQEYISAKRQKKILRGHKKILRGQKKILRAIKEIESR